MWLALLNFLGGPIVARALDAYRAKLANDSNIDQRTVDLAAKQMLVDQREAELRNQLKVAEIGHAFEPEKLFAYIMVIFFAKVIVWDKVLGLGVTDPITGDAAKWAGMIMTFYVGSAGVQNVVRILKR